MSTQHLVQIHRLLSSGPPLYSQDKINKMAEREAVSLRWENICFVAPSKGFANLGRKTKVPNTLLDNIHGHLVPGKLLAIMGPSGAGKSTLLDILADRVRPTSGTVETVARVQLNATQNRDLESGPQDYNATVLKSYVEQHDTLLGTLTVRETLHYSAKLSMPRATPPKEIKNRVDTIISGLGLGSVADNMIGTPVMRGISGGQKRRVTIGCSLVAMPSVLFLDEPTSGLDIHTAYEVISSIARFSQQYKIAVCATIHSPNRDIFNLFDRVMLLARGRTVYYGPTHDVGAYMAELGVPCPTLTNEADHMLRIVSDEMYEMSSKNKNENGAQLNGEGIRGNVERLGALWQERVVRQGDQMYKHCAFSQAASSLRTPTTEANFSSGTTPKETRHSLYDALQHLAFATSILSRRNALNYRRNILAYGVRFAMYIGMGVLLATVWVNLAALDTRINDRLSVHFFSVAFLGFMSVAGIPSFLEERSVMRRERGNGLYGAAPFTLANTFVTMPFLFACAIVFAVIMYWSIGLRSGAMPFFRWLAVLYLGVLAAETQSLLVAALIPVFVAALAVAAFLNGFWMTTQGYFIRTDSLPRFWYYWAHFINYETYALALLVRIDFRGLVFKCAIPGQCTYPAAPQQPNEVLGQTVISTLQFDTISFGAQAAILLAIIVFYRLLFYVVLRLQKI